MTKCLHRVYSRYFVFYGIMCKYLINIMVSKYIAENIAL